MFLWITAVGILFTAVYLLVSLAIGVRSPFRPTTQSIEGDFATRVKKVLGEIEFVKPGPNKRICAFLIDLIVIFSFGWLVALYSYDNIGWGLVVIYLLFRDANKGQSMGKMIVGLKVIDDRNEAVTFVESLIRNVSMVIPFFCLIEYVAMIKDSQGRRLGDIPAKTRVTDIFPKRSDRLFLYVSFVLMLLLVSGHAFIELYLKNPNHPSAHTVKTDFPGYSPKNSPIIKYENEQLVNSLYGYALNVPSGGKLTEDSTYENMNYTYLDPAGVAVTWSISVSTYYRGTKIKSAYEETMKYYLEMDNRFDIFPVKEFFIKGNRAKQLIFKRYNISEKSYTVVYLYKPNDDAPLYTVMCMDGVIKKENLYLADSVMKSFELIDSKN